MRGDRRSRGAAPHPCEDAGLRVCVDVPGLNRAASQELFWPSHVGRCEGPPHSYVCMPFDLPNAAAAHQRLLWSILAAQEARRNHAEASGWAVEYIQRAIQAGILTGVDDGKGGLTIASPQGPAIRQEMAAMGVAILEAVKKELGS